MTRVIHARSIASLGIGVVIMLMVMSATASACDQYVITGVKTASISESRPTGAPGILVTREIDVPAGGADTAIVALSLATLSFSPFVTIMTFPDTTQIKVQLSPTDHKFNTGTAHAKFDGFSNNKAKIVFNAILSDKNADDPFYAELAATVIFLKCCKVSCGTPDSSTIWFDINKIREQFGALNGEVIKLKTQVADLERRR